MNPNLFKLQYTVRLHVMPFDYIRLMVNLITRSSLISAEFGGASFDGAGTTYELSGAHGRLVRVHLRDQALFGFEHDQKAYQNSISALCCRKVKNHQ